MDDPHTVGGRDSQSGQGRRAPSRAVPRCHRPERLAALLQRQLEAIDAWNAARALRERTIRESVGSRDQRLDAARRGDALRRTQQSLLDHLTARQTAPCGPLVAPGLSVVLAHSNPWYAGRIGQALEADGAAVLGVTGNGADALGILIAEQPALLFVGDRLAMTTAPALLAEAALFSPRTVLVAQGDVEEEPCLLHAGARAVLPRVLAPAGVGQRLHELLVDAADRRAG